VLLLPSDWTSWKSWENIKERERKKENEMELKKEIKSDSYLWDSQLLQAHFVVIFFHVGDEIFFLTIFIDKKEAFSLTTDADDEVSENFPLKNGERKDRFQS
jgi:hypothetical protein